MHTTPDPLGLHSPDGRRAQLLSAQLEAEVLGLMLRLSVRQIWRNTTGAPMAARLNLGLSHGQCLLELQAGRGDGPLTPMPVRPTQGQPCSAAMGVLQTGEQLTLHWRVAELLDLQGGSLRLHWPAHLLPPAVRPGRLTLTLHDPLAHGTLGSASHPLQKVRHTHGLTLSLLAPQGLRQDFGLSVHGLRDTGLALACAHPDPSGHGMVLASQAWRPTPGLPARPLRLKLVLDHTGAIPPERQTALHSALDALLAGLQPHDHLSLSRVGQGLQHLLPRLQPCTEAYVRRARALLRHPPMDSGTPDWTDVLNGVLDIADEEEHSVQDVNLLIITAHPLRADACLHPQLRARQHRLHVLTVGEAAERSDWHALARLSDGQGQNLGPGQQAVQALQNLFERMRRLYPVQAQLIVQNEPLANVQSSHHTLASGDTLHVWAPLPPALAQVRADLRPDAQWPLEWGWQIEGEDAHLHRSGPWPVRWDAQGDLLRLCAHLQAALADASSRPSAPRVTASVTPSISLSAAVASSTPPSATDPAPRMPQLAAATRLPPAGTVASVRPLPASSVGSAPHPVTAVVQEFNRQAGAYRQFRAALSATLSRCNTRAIDGLVMALARRAGNPGRVWALLLHHWHAQQTLALQAHALALVEQELAPWPIGARSEIHAQLTLALNAAARQAA